MTPESLSPARCWDVDRAALGLCPRLDKRHRLLLGAALDEGARQAGEHFELMAEISRARGARARAGLDLPAPPHPVPTRGVAGNLRAALAELPERRSRIRLAGSR